MVFHCADCTRPDVLAANHSSLTVRCCFMPSRSSVCFLPLKEPLDRKILVKRIHEARHVFSQLCRSVGLNLNLESCSKQGTLPKMEGVTLQRYQNQRRIGLILTKNSHFVIFVRKCSETRNMFVKAAEQCPVPTRLASAHPVRRGNNTLRFGRIVPCQLKHF